MSAATSGLTILRRKQVEERTGLSRASIYAKTRLNPARPGDFDANFPKPIRLGGRAVGWVESEVNGWIAEQVRKSRGGQ